MSYARRLWSNEVHNFKVRHGKALPGISDSVISSVSISVVLVGTFYFGNLTKLVHSYFVSEFVSACIGRYRLVHENLSLIFFLILFKLYIIKEKI